MYELLRLQVRRRARGCCEYCHFPEGADFSPFQIDHIIAEQHRGLTTLGNLAYACLMCNQHKGPNIASLDPINRKLVRLFNPRRHKWARHFFWDGPILRGQTGVGRATILVLAMNDPENVAARQTLIEEGRFPID